MAILTRWSPSPVTRLPVTDRRPGYLRLCEFLHVEPTRIPPDWAQVRESIGAPRLYVSASCRELIRQLKSAPVAFDGPDAGEAVDPHWESEHGHAIASIRYGAMSRPLPSERAKKITETPNELRAAAFSEYEAGVLDQIETYGDFEFVYVGS